MRHLTADPLPDGIYAPAEAAIVRYAQKSTRLEPIDKATYAALESLFSPAQIIVSNVETGNSFHAGKLAPEIVDASFR